MSLYYATSVIMDGDSKLDHKVHVSSISGELIGVITFGDSLCDRLTVHPRTMQDLDRLIAALRDLKVDWLALADRLALDGQPTLLENTSDGVTAA